MDTSCGMLRGRPFGGIGILWRKSFGSCIRIHKYDDDSRVMAIEFNDGNRKLLAVNIYMPCDDVDCLGCCSGAFTYLSEAHGTTSWIGHCVCTEQAHSSITDVNICYDMQSSDHFPISICIDVSSVPRLDCAYTPPQSRLNWSKASERDRSMYRDKCAELLDSIELPRDAACCSDTSCKDSSHIEGARDLYCCIANALNCAAVNAIPVTKGNCNADDHNIPGWNDFIKAEHADARDAFKFWVVSGKPRQGDVFDSMRMSRAKFKYLLRKCRREEATIRADNLASELCNNDPTLFWSWKEVAKQNSGSLKLADMVGGATGHVAIASMWNEHYSQLFNCVKGDTHKRDVLDAVNRVSGGGDVFDHNDVRSAVASLCVNKACGLDSLSAEHLMYASPKIHILLAICFNAFIVHDFLPSSMTDTVLYLLPDKCKNISDKGNYRHIALSSVVSKVFELVLLGKLKSCLCTSDYQFGFKSNHSTDLCIYTLKEVIDLYKSQSSSIYLCFMNASKAFDRVNHWTLFKKLIDRDL